MAYGQEYTTAHRKNVPLLDKYRCRICEKWKEPHSFSNKELNDYAFKVANGTKFNGVTAKLRCRVCAGGAVTEKQCEGPCKMWKDLQNFSKSARSNGGSHACKACTIWVESQEPDMATEAPPTASHPAGEDDDVNHWTLPTYDDPEAGESGSDYEDYAHTTTSKAGTMATHVSAPAPGTRQTPSVATGFVGSRQHVKVPYNALATLSMNGPSDTSNPGTLRTMPTANLSAATMSGARIPPSSALPSGSGAASGVGPVGSRTALPTTSNDLRSQSSASTPYERSSTTQAAGWAPLDVRRAPVNYTGWDNKGQPHAQQRFPSGSQTQPSTSFASSPAPAPVATHHSSWAAAGSRNPQQSTAPPTVGARHGVTGVTQPRGHRLEYDDSDSDSDLFDM